MALPTLTVSLDDGTGAFPFNITAYVMALDGYEISRGRSDWQGAVTAGELRLTLNNSDGRFTPGSTTLATPSPITVDQQIRVKETVNGVTYTRFTGYVKSWPVSWPATVVTFATVAAGATDAQARAERTTLRSMLEEEILLDSPSAYYTLGEVEGSTSAGDTSGNQGSPLVASGTGTAFTMGTGTGPVDGLTATQFFGGQWLEVGDTTAAVTIPSTGGLVATFTTTTTPAFETVIAYSQGWRVGVNLTGQVYGFAGAILTAGPVVTDGSTHAIGLVCDGATISLVVDGVVVTTTPFSSTSAPASTSAGGSSWMVSDTPFVGTVSHVATFSALTAVQAQAISSVALGLTESGTARITRLAGYADIPTGTLDTSLTTVSTQVTTGAGAFSAIQDVADAEGGLVFIDGSGNLTFHNRDRPSAKTTPDLTLSSQYVTPEVQPVLDDQTIVNYFEATAVGTGSAQLARNLASEATHGRYPDSKSFLVLTDQEALDRGNWTVGKLAEPATRYGTLTVNLFGMTASQASTVLAALDLNCWLRVTSMASQTPGGTTVDVVVEGWQEQVTAESWTITCNVVARSLFEAFILNDTTYGVLDSDVLGL